MPEEELKLSYSAISSYRNCPHQYYLRYVEKRPSLPSPALSFGNSLHEALRWLYSCPTPHPPSAEELIDYLERCWVSEGYCSPGEEARYFYQARSTLQLFYRHNIAGPDEFMLPVALEHRFKIDLGFCFLSGVIDRVDKDAEGGFEIIDYKTSRRLPPAKYLYKDLQLPLYHIAAQKIWEIEPRQVTFYYLLPNHRFSYAVTPHRSREALAEVESVADAIRDGRFDPRENNLCPWCDYLDECPLLQGRAPGRKKAPYSPPLEMGQAVDELVELERQIRVKETLLAGLEQEVRDYLDSKGCNRIEGNVGLACIDDGGDLTWTERGS